MLFDKKVKRDMEVMNERNKRYLESRESDGASDDATEASNDEAYQEAMARAEEYRRQNDDAGLEKGDIPALILSALLVFGPIILVLAALLALAWILLS